MEWDGVRYVELENCGAQSRLLPWLHEAVRYVLDRQTKEMRLVPFEANPHSMRAALESIKAYVHLPESVECPSWLDGRSHPPPNEILVTRFSLIHLPSGQCLEPTPQLFVTNALDFDLDPEAPEPKEWHRFLGQLFGDDTESIELLQDWFGYSLMADTSQQQMLLVIGPTRSGKGTIARVLGQLVGKGNICGPMTSSLAGTFGLQPLIGKSLAIVSDARFVGQSIATVVERLLAISGEDEVTIDRKYETPVTMKLPTRFVFITNELPKLNDASGALAGRFVILRLTESFYGREDIGLTRLLTELPGILNWAIAGWKRLHQRGHFVMPRHCQDALTDLEELTSPVIAFVREKCLVDPSARIWCDELYSAWEHWCFVNGRTVVPPNHVFGKELSAAYSKVIARRGTGNRRFYEGITMRRELP
jgi:P4 family phage/plasmid primase-like protien